MSKKIEGATKEWIKTFNAIPRSLLVRLRNYDPAREPVFEITTPNVGVGGTFFDENGRPRAMGTLVAYNAEDKTFALFDDETQTIKMVPEKRTFVDEADFPKGDKLWSFDNKSDETWCKEHRREISKMGFRIFYQEDYGIIIGHDTPSLEN